MRKSKALMPMLFISMLLSIGCKKDVSTDSIMMMQEDKIQSSGLTQQVKEKLHQLRASLPAGYEKRLEKISNLLLEGHPEFQKMAESFMNVLPTPCNNNTIWSQWMIDQTADWDKDVRFFYDNSGMGAFPFYHARYFEHSSENQYFGARGEYTQRITKAFKDLHSFWDIDVKDIVLVGIHGNMLLDRDKLIRTDKLMFDDDQATAEYWADLILMMIAEVPQYRNGEHPFFTFNAFAGRTFIYPPYGVIPYQIIMGDGMMESFTEIGYDDVAQQLILAHEFGHHIQFRLGFYDIGIPGAERTRRLELMADAFSSYYLSHARGAAMQWKRVQQFLQVFFNLGDCGFTSTLHHGTHTQRMAAAEWAYKIADESIVQGHILTSLEFTALFEANLPTILAH